MKARFLEILTTFLFVIPLSGCSFIDSPDTTVKIPESWQYDIASSGHAPQILMDDWWKSANDPILADLMKQVNVQNLSLEQAEYRLHAARQDIQNSAYLPNFMTSSTGIYNKPLNSSQSSANSDTTGYYKASLDASWEIPLWGQFRDTKDISKAKIKYALSDLNAIRSSVIAETLTTYADLRASQMKLVKYQAIKAAQERALELTKIQLSAGLIPKTNVVEQSVIILTAQQDIERETTQIENSKQKILQLTAQTSVNPPWEKYAELPVFAIPAVSNTPVDVLRNRPDIARAEASVLIAAAELNIAKSELYPKLTLSGTLSKLTNIIGNPLLANTVDLGWTPVVSLPLFDWSKRLSSARIQEASLQEKASAYKETVINALSEAQYDRIALENAKNNFDLSKDSNLKINELETMKQTLLRQGLIDRIEIEMIKIEVLKADIICISAQYEEIAHLVAFTKSLGGGLPTNTLEKTKENP